MSNTNVNSERVILDGSPSSERDSSSFGFSGVDIIDIGELSWSDRIRPKPKIQGKYLRGDILGQGTFAKVYEVLDITTLQRRAVKVFDMHKIDRKLNREEMVAMINQEVALLAICDHPNVIKMVDIKRSVPLNSEQSSRSSSESEISIDQVKENGEKEEDKKVKEEDEDEDEDEDNKVTEKVKQSTDNQQLSLSIESRKIKYNSRKNKIWMYLEYCMASVGELMNLSDPVRCASLPLNQARHYFIGLVKGLEYLHSKGIFHKDIKPDNMLINVFNTIKITDLSVSHVVDLFTPSDTCYNTYGTISYQSPEVLFSSDLGYSASALDVWSAGVTLYVMVNGKLPFSTENGLIAMTESIQKDEPELTHILTENPCLAELIDFMLVKDPTDRARLHQIIHHPWLKADSPQNKPIIKIPPRYAFGDQYRSLTITAYLHELHYPLPNQQNIVTVSETSADEFNVKRKIPIVRSNRSPTRRKVKKKIPGVIIGQLAPTRKLGRILGAFGLQPETIDENATVLVKTPSNTSTDSNASHFSLS